uniref:Uncharacterized protein n=1 Tax=Cacopsylla melanoneura TaxID=428564 RepID=A0A8D8V7S6_9HEMI
MDSDMDSAPEDVPIGLEPVDAMFSKRLMAKKIQREKNLNKKKLQKDTQKQLKPLPIEVLEQLSQEIPNITPPATKISKIKKATQKKSTETRKNEHAACETVDFLPLDSVNRKCATKFKVGVLTSIMKNSSSKRNYKEYALFGSKHAQARRKGNVKKDIIKKVLMKRLISKR